MARCPGRVPVGLQLEHQTRAFKVVILGETGVGKTSLATRLNDSPLPPAPSSPTIGLNFTICNVNVDNTWIRVNVWDTAGQERFNSLLPAYCRRSHGAIFVFDLTDLRTFLCLDKCMRWAEETLPENTCKLLVGNKKDLADRGMRAVTSWMAQEWANHEGACYVELSMLDPSTDLNKAFTAFMRQLMRQWPPVTPSYDQNKNEAKGRLDKSKCCT